MAFNPTCSPRRPKAAYKERHKRYKEHETTIKNKLQNKLNPMSVRTILRSYPTVPRASTETRGIWHWVSMPGRSQCQREYQAWERGRDGGRGCVEPFLRLNTVAAILSLVAAPDHRIRL